MSDRFPVRVMVTPAWDTVDVSAEDAMTVGQLKREALRAALRSSAADDPDYQVKFRGAAIGDESTTLGALRAVPNAPFIVLPVRRQPVR